MLEMQISHESHACFQIPALFNEKFTFKNSKCNYYTNYFFTKVFFQRKLFDQTFIIYYYIYLLLHLFHRIYFISQRTRLIDYFSKKHVFINFMQRKS